MKKRFLPLAILLLTIFPLLFSGCGKLQGEAHPQVDIYFEDIGVIRVELDRIYAPKTTDHFLALVAQGFYNGLPVSRIIAEGFMQINGGSVLEKNAPKVKGEFSKNNVNNRLSHIRGALSMARPDDDYNGARGSFFICQDDLSEDYDGEYAVFGHVLLGMSLVDDIIENTPVVDETTGDVQEGQGPIIEKMVLVDP